MSLINYTIDKYFIAVGGKSVIQDVERADVSIIITTKRVRPGFGIIRKIVICV